MSTGAGEQEASMDSKEKRWELVMDRGGLPDNDDEVSQRKRKFKQRLTKAHHAIENIDQFLTKKIRTLVKNAPAKYHNEMILQTVTTKENALLYSLNRQCYKLFLGLMRKIDAKEYLLSTHDLLQNTFESNDDQHFGTVLNALSAQELTSFSRNYLNI